MNNVEMRRTMTLIVCAGALLAGGVVALIVVARILDRAAGWKAISSGLAVLLFATLAYALLVVWTLYDALVRTQRNEGELARVRDELSATNAVLEMRVAERATTIQYLAREREAAQQAQLEALQSPAFPIWDRIVVLPLTGALDTFRIDALIRSACEGVERYRARVLIVSIGGVPVVDSTAAGALLRMTRVVRLLGAQCLLAGVHVDVALTMAFLGLDLAGPDDDGIEVFGNVRLALARAFALTGQVVVDEAEAITLNELYEAMAQEYKEEQ